MIYCSVKSRMESGAGMCFSEFSYQVFQSYDWLHLFKTHNCRIQVRSDELLYAAMPTQYHISNIDVESQIYLNIFQNSKNVFKII